MDKHTPLSPATRSSTSEIGARKASWLARLFGHGSLSTGPVLLDELFQESKLNQFQLGSETETGHRIALDLPWSRRHLLLVGPNGKGAAVAQDHLAAQHLVRGGGLLVLDSTPNMHSPRLLTAVADACGRTDFKHYQADRTHPATAIDVGNLVSRAGAAYVTLQPYTSQAEAKRTVETIVNLLLPAARFTSEAGKPTKPFMVIVPDLGWLLTDAWRPLLECARTYGILLVLRLQNLAELMNVSPPVADSVLNCGTKIFLQPNTPAAVEAAAQLITLSGDSQKVAETRGDLAALSLGQALLCREGSVEKLSLRMVSVGGKSSG